MNRTYIEPIKSMSEVKTYIGEIISAYNNEDVLCFFDIDETILEPVTLAAQLHNILKHKDIFLELKLKYSGFYPTVHGTCLLLDDHKVLDNDVFDVFNLLNDKKIQNLAFTATPNMILDGQNLKEVRFKQLEENNVNFENNFSEKEFIFDNLNLCHGHPILYRGIIFSNGDDVFNNKGLVLNEFLCRTNANKKCIIFIDDNIHNLIDINQTLAVNHPEIDFYGIYFLGAHYSQNPGVSKEEFRNLWEDYFLRESYSCEKIKRKIFNM